MSYGLDFEYFRQPGFLVKEMTIIFLETDSDPTVLLFKAPYHWCSLSEKYRSKNINIQRNKHGLFWDSGFYNYNELGYPHKIYAIGDKKKKFIRFNINTFDITDFGYLDTSKGVHFCSNHDFRYKIQCATQNAKLIKKCMNAKRNGRMLRRSGSTNKWLETIHGKVILEIKPSPARGRILPGAGLDRDAASHSACMPARDSIAQQAVALDSLRVQIF